MFGSTNNDYARDRNDRKSTSKYVFMLGLCAISWSSKKQSIATLFTTKTKFAVAISYACQAIWLWKILEFVHSKQEGATLIYYDNTLTIKLLKEKSPIMHEEANILMLDFISWEISQQ